MRSRDKPKTLYLYNHNIYGHQLDLLCGIQLIKLHDPLITYSCEMEMNE